VKTIRLPGAQPFTVPHFSLLACVENIGPVIEDALTDPRIFRRSEEGGMHVYTLIQTLPVEGWAPAFVIDGRTLYFTTSRAFYDECRASKSALATSPAFQEAIAHVGTEGNGLSYVRPEFFQQLHRLPELNASLPASDRALMDFVVSRLPAPEHPLIGVRTNLPDGVLVRSYLNRSLKQDAAMVAVYNPVTIGMLSAMAIPAFQKVRASSQEKAVLNNLRQLSAAADQYYLENGVSSVTFDQLVGPDRYIKRIPSVAGEDYRQLRFSLGEPLQVRLPDGRVVRYAP
jgi:type IV pilus assembly protein PilA